MPKSQENFIAINEIGNYDAFSTTEFKVFITSSIMKFTVAPLMLAGIMVVVQIFQIPLVKALFFRLGDWELAPTQ